MSLRIGHTAPRLRSGLAGLILLAALPAPLAHTLPDDRDQPIHISADKALRDEKKGVTVYSGNVLMVQGSMELEASTLTIYQVTETADKIVAEGTPAKMRQQPEIDKDLVHAHAAIITYYKNKELVHLQTDARVEQKGDLVTGDSIDYFIADQLIRAEADQSREGNKVEVVIQPTPTATSPVRANPVAEGTSSPLESTLAEAIDTPLATSQTQQDEATLGAPASE